MASIIIVEDNAELSNFFSLLLSENGHVAAKARSGKELWGLLESSRPDLLLMDVMLGGEDGRALCGDIRRIYPGIKVILLSASPQMLENFRECGADDTIEKPFNLSEVISRIDTLLSLR
jgi:DNA-binding response OmpR family regulator